MSKRFYPLALFIGVGLLGSAALDAYPSKPSHVRIAFELGTLVEYTLGNHSGGLTIRRKDGTFDLFLIAYPNKINGRHYLCQSLPYVGETGPYPGAAAEPKPASCPKNVIVGKTDVRVSYWWGTMRGKPAKISDEITTFGS
jgi:hypothetical protein